MIDQSKPGQLVIHGKKYIGKVYDINGEQFEVYRIGALAMALGKNSRTVEKWERDGLFPKPVFQMIVRKGDGHCKRWYTRGQILNLHKVWTLFPIARGRGSTKNRFFSTAQKVFYKLNEVSITVEQKSDVRQNIQPVSGSTAERSTGRQDTHPAAASEHPRKETARTHAVGERHQQGSVRSVPPAQPSLQRAATGSAPKAGRSKSN